MDGNTPQVESVPGKNRRWNIALATILVVAIIVTVAGILVLVTQTDTVADKTDKASGNISTLEESQGELEQRRSDWVFPTVDAAPMQTTGASNTSYHAETTQSTYTSIEPDGKSGRQPESSKYVSNDTSQTAADAAYTLTTRESISNASQRVETTQSTSVSTKMRTTAHSSIQDTTESLLAVWHNTTNASYSYKLYKELKSYPEAEEICQSVNSKLASTGVRNGDAKSEIVNIISEIRDAVKVKAYVWIGLRIDSVNSTTWTWSDGYVQEQDSIKSWGADQPNRIRRGVVEKCVAITTKMDAVKNETGLLHDCPCEKELPFICEKRNKI